MYAADSELEPMLLAASAGFAVAAVRRSLRWKEDSPDRPKLRESLGQFLRGTAQDFGDEYLDAIDLELKVRVGPQEPKSRVFYPHFRCVVWAPSRHRVPTLSMNET